MKDIQTFLDIMVAILALVALIASIIHKDWLHAAMSYGFMNYAIRCIVYSIRPESPPWCGIR